ncbi:DUF3311 domain-containing protein [Streptomyces sp. Li-HN-5-11]|uniref:DUF3311 domain-containing protein n=1 Tax=Streptomyces sp. Li-HN-5-11 TaxID=3075432 RepID=UPI0028AEEDEE|nr:DUF3311 domain-containing protein [Streptomyces sp. Li-HN-5-11]WNM35235.1 DUF3311 domain-containing protein [Streptomyces sp. Li-HN-5-11]
MKTVHLLGVVPFAGILGGVFFANRVTPYVLGMPFILFWLVMWVVLISATMAVIYRLDPANRTALAEPGPGPEARPEPQPQREERTS